MNNNILKKGILLSIPFLALIVYLVVKFNLNEIVLSMPKCFFYSNFNIYCPACGNTRCIASLINLDILSAIRYNPFTFGVILCIMLVYVEQFVIVFFKKKIKLIPRKPLFWWLLGIILTIFYILRMFFEFLR